MNFHHEQIFKHIVFNSQKSVFEPDTVQSFQYTVAAEVFAAENISSLDKLNRMC